MSSWLRHLQLTVRSKTGLSSGVLVWGLVATLGGAVTLGFLSLPPTSRWRKRYGSLTAALALGGLFLLTTINRIDLLLSSQRRTVASAKLALAARSPAPWLDPKLLGAGLQIGRAIGWRRLVPLAALAARSSTAA